MKEGSEKVTLRKGESRGQKAFVYTTRTDRNKRSPLLVDSGWGAVCQTPCDGVDQEDWESMHTARCGKRRIK